MTKKQTPEVKDTYVASRGVKSLEASSDRFEALSDDVKKATLGKFIEILKDDKRAEEFFDYMAKVAKKEGIDQQSMDEFVLRKQRPELFPDLCDKV